MKNYSRALATKGKTTFRTGDRWRARKNIVVRNIKIFPPKNYRSISKSDIFPYSYYDIIAGKL